MSVRQSTITLAPLSKGDLSHPSSISLIPKASATNPAL
ncbi:Uncharacterised protein [Vibrio cholerae]|nr:Uncharacterised protein [Vibrio cholerae]